MPAWSAYACKISDSFPMDIVHHGTHVGDARRIIEDGLIEAGLIYDESVLNKTRTCVTWFSPNEWVNGSRYGTVQLSFSWREIIGDRRLYWVEAITRYSPTACRFLLSKRKLTERDGVIPYDPEVEKGPLRLRDEEWFWNPRVTIELMLDEDVNVATARELGFLRHHPQYCSQGGCDRLSRESSAAMVLAHILARSAFQLDDALAYRSGPNKGKPTDAVQSGIVAISDALGPNRSSFGGPVSGSAALPLVRGALLQLSVGRTKDARKVVGLLKSQEHFEESLRTLAAEHFDSGKYSFPWDD